MNYIWAGIIVISIIFGIVNGNADALSDAVFSGGKLAIELCITLLGSICLWNGLMLIADKAGLTKVCARALRPVLKVIFPGMDTKSPAARAISMNISANVLGLGNAATPFGIEAMKQLQMMNPIKERATDHMIMFVIINTASVQLIPTTISMMRMNNGAANPMDIMPAIWIASGVILTIGVILARVVGGRSR